MTMKEKSDAMFKIESEKHNNVELNKMQYRVNMAESFITDARKKGVFSPDDEMQALQLLKDLDMMRYDVRYAKDKDAQKRIESMRKQLMSVPELKKKAKRRWLRRRKNE